jgi:threonine/homoserine/homoserine lactone efflux protein
VQAILLAESLRGGTTRGLRAMAGANLTFGVLLVGLALGISVATPGETAVRALKIVGGLFLGWLAYDGFRTASATQQGASDRAALPPAARGALAVLLNPPAWLFLATAASSLMATANELGGQPAALAAALALQGGIAVGDIIVVLAAGLGLRRASAPVGSWTRRGLALVLAGLGISLVLSGVLG